ncbi:MAG: SDR family NAD(P)-dependent oxidoreductase, partial [Rhodospirillaceae bacterium]|nr:SDR family NAD(P)-dependent oxidoreductase [Rhodospirillaceae bacterium]
MDLGIKGKRALVTGGSRGIGASVAKTLAAEGARVAVVSRDAESVETLIGELGGERSGHYGQPLDLMEDGACPAFIDDLEKNFGQVDIVVQNLGGPMGVNDPLCGIEDWRQVLHFNLEITIELNGLLIPHMKAQKWGRIVHVSSIAGVENTGPVPYCTAKAALCAYTRSFGRVL